MKCLHLLTTVLIQSQLATAIDEVDFCDGALAKFAHGVGGFCLNGGACRDGLPADTLEPCDCPPDLQGPHCEFEKGVVPDCSRHLCYNDGQCVAGLKHWNEQVASTDAMMFCVCAEGYYGEHCEYEEKPCGDDHCRNGGTCVTVEAEDGQSYEYCDCTSSGDGTHPFAGAYCENGATSTCAHDQNGHNFCTNGGLCRPDAYLGCECPDGFVGPSCEFEDKGLENLDCHTQCHHDGICRKGAKDTSYLEKYGIHHHRHLSKKYNEDFEHCVCPTGFVGLHCEYRMDVCPGGQKACLNGSECSPVADSEGFRWTCDCAHVDTPYAMYAGDLCEHESTSYCTQDGEQPAKGTGHEAFCVNDGVCKALVGNNHPHPGCYCPEGWTGDRCEYEVGQVVTQDDGFQFTLLHGGAIFLAVVLAVVAGFYLRKYRQQRNGDYYSPQYIQNYTDEDDMAPAPTMDDVQSTPWQYSDAVSDNDSLNEGEVVGAHSTSVSFMKEPLDDEESDDPDMTFL